MAFYYVLSASSAGLLLLLSLFLIIIIIFSHTSSSNSIIICSTWSISKCSFSLNIFLQLILSAPTMIVGALANYSNNLNGFWIGHCEALCVACLFSDPV